MSKERAKMSIADRAKQFMSFDALKGFGKELEAMERIPADRPLLADDRTDELDRIIKQIEPGNIITVIYYDSGEYIKRSGVVSEIDMEQRRLCIVKTIILFDDIYEIAV